MPQIRSLPRLFLPGADPSQPVIELPKEESDKLRKVLRLSAGAPIAVLPDDGTLLVCEFRGNEAIIKDRRELNTESRLKVTLAQALPRPDKLDEVVRLGTEIGVAEFVIFPTERTVVRWDMPKVEERMKRLRTIAREAAEVSFRCRLPKIRYADSLKRVLGEFPDAAVLSEVESVSKTLSARLKEAATAITLVIGPEGGWAPTEVKLIGNRSVTLGPRVLRVDTAAAAACSITLLL